MSTPAGNLNADAGAITGADVSTSTPDSAAHVGGTGEISYPDRFRFNAEDMASLDGPTADASAVPQPAPEAEPAPEPQPVPAPAAAPATPVPVPEAEPTTPPAEVSTSDAVGELFSPLLTNFDTPEQGVDNAETFLQNLETYDAGAARSLLNAVFDSKKNILTTWALQELGFQPAHIPALVERAEAISEWLSKGGELPIDEGLPTFPQADEFGVVGMTPELAKILGDDIETLDLNKPGDKAAYQAAKQVFDREIKDIRAARDQESQEQQAAVDREIAAADKREQDFSKGRVAVLNQTFADLKVDYGEDKMAPQAVVALAQNLLLNDPEMHRLDAEGARLAREGGSRLAIVAQQMDARIKGHINSAVQYFNNVILNANRAERGARATDPVLPEGVKKIAAGATATTPAPQKQGPQNIDSVIRDFGDPAYWERELGG